MSDTEQTEINDAEVDNSFAEENNELLNMSDEDILNIDFSNYDSLQEQESAEDSQNVGTIEDSEIQSEEESEEVENSEGPEKTEITEELSDLEETEDSEDSEQGTEEPNYKDMLEAVMSPFESGGTEFKINSVEEARKLMEQGAHWGKKMQELAPHRKILKTMEKEGISSEDINFLIDLKAKNPQAISKLIKDSGIDPMELDEYDNTYQTKDYSPTEAAMQLSDVLDEIKDSPSYVKTIEIVGTRWDNKSKEELSTVPQAIKVINDHVTNGIYDIVSGEVIKQKALGNLIGLSDFEAYQKVGEYLNNQGAFGHLNTDKSELQTKKPETVKNLPAQKKTENTKSNSKKAASPPNKKSNSKSSSEIDILNMSDEEFLKIYGDQLPY